MNDLPRVCFIDHTAQLGGGEIALLNMVRALDSNRFVPVVVLGSDGVLRKRLLEAGVETHLLPMARSVTETRKDALGIHSLLRVADVARIIGYCVKLAGFIRSSQISLVHTNSLKADLIGGVAARLAGVPVVWHVRDRIADDYLPPVVARFFRFLCRIIPNSVIANSKATLSSLALPASDPKNGKFQGMVIYSGSVIYDGVNLDGNQAGNVAESRQRAPAAARIGLIGRLAPWKGQHIFLRAAAEVIKTYPECRFLIIGSALFGEDAYEQEICALVASLGLTEHIEFTGFRSDVADLIQHLDILVHASITGEPFGQVVIEAMAASKPVIATNGGGIPEIVRDGITGLLVPMGDVAAMASAIMRLVADPQNADEMGKEGRRRVGEFFTIEIAARRMEELFASLIVNKTPGIDQKIKLSTSI